MEKKCSIHVPHIQTLKSKCRQPEFEDVPKIHTSTPTPKYRSALTQPLFLYFGMDIRVSCIGSLLKSIRLKNPQDPPTRPTWSLNKVLSHLDTLDVSIKFNLLRKTAFLLLLATGWRLGELHACVRDQEHCRFTPTQSLVLRPHKSFMAKNGHKNRLKPKEISTLKDTEGNISNICPVTTLREYLGTNRDCNKSLFLNTNLYKELTLQGLNSAICSVIRRRA